jgi:hypothetical protein
LKRELLQSLIDQLPASNIPFYLPYNGGNGGSLRVSQKPQAGQELLFRWQARRGPSANGPQSRSIIS